MILFLKSLFTKRFLPVEENLCWPYTEQGQGYLLLSHELLIWICNVLCRDTLADKWSFFCMLYSNSNEAKLQREACSAVGNKQWCWSLHTQSRMSPWRGADCTGSRLNPVQWWVMDDCPSEKAENERTVYTQSSTIWQAEPEMGEWRMFLLLPLLPFTSTPMCLAGVRNPSSNGLKLSLWVQAIFGKEGMG